MATFLGAGALLIINGFLGLTALEFYTKYWEDTQQRYAKRFTYLRSFGVASAVMGVVTVGFTQVIAGKVITLPLVILAPAWLLSVRLLCLSNTVLETSNERRTLGAWIKSQYAVCVEISPDFSTCWAAGLSEYAMRDLFKKAMRALTMAGILPLGDTLTPHSARCVVQFMMGLTEDNRQDVFVRVSEVQQRVTCLHKEQHLHKWNRKKVYEMCSEHEQLELIARLFSSEEEYSLFLKKCFFVRKKHWRVRKLPRRPCTKQRYREVLK